MSVLRRRSFCLVGLLVAGVVSACADEVTGRGGEDGTSTAILSRAGAAVMRVHPGDTIPLQVVGVEPGVGPVAGALVEWRLVNDPGGTQLGRGPAATDDTGQATTTVTPVTTGDVVIEAVSPGLSGTPAWKLEVRPVVRFLRIVPSAGIRLKGQDGANEGDPSEATVSAGTGRHVALRVKVVEETVDGLRPLSGQPVSFTLVGGVAGARLLDAGRARTRADGTADGRLAVGTVAGAYLVEAALDGGMRVTFAVTVSDVAGELPSDPGNPDTGRDVPCVTDKQCVATQVCREGKCIDPGSLTCGASGLCPYGHLCENNRCVVPASSDCARCPAGTACDAATNACVAAESECPCPAGFACRSGLCMSSSGPALDVTGAWYTLNRFDVAAALPSWVNDLHQATGAVADAATGRLGLGSPWDQMVKAIVREFIPDWALSVVALLDGLLDLFSTLRASGEMTLTAAGAPGALVGSETWTTLRMNLPAACHGATSSPSNPCDTVEIPIEDLPTLSGRFRAQPFTARVGGTTREDMTLIVDPREVDLRLGGLLKVLLDISVEVVTAGRYRTLEDRACRAGENASRDRCGPGSGALSGLIDCAGLGASVGLPEATDLCRQAVSKAANRVVGAVSQVTVSAEVLRYRGQASVSTASGPSEPRATLLGHEEFLTRSEADGRWRGRYLFVDDVPGRWRAARSPLAWPSPAP